MTIVSLEYTNEERTSIKVTEDDGNIYFASYPNATWRGPQIDEAIAGGLIVSDYVAPPAPPVYVSKLKIVDNLIAAGKITEALTAIGADPVVKARWEAASEISKDDATAIALVTSLGLDPAVILA